MVGSGLYWESAKAKVQGMDFIGVDYRNGLQRHGYERVGNSYFDI